MPHSRPSAAQEILNRRAKQSRIYTKRQKPLRKKERRQVRTAVRGNFEILFTPKKCECTQIWDPRKLELTVKRNNVRHHTPPKTPAHGPTATTPTATEPQPQKAHANERHSQEPAITTALLQRITRRLSFD